MENRGIKVLLALAAVATVLGVGAVAAGAGVYALTRGGSVLPAVKAQAGNPETGVIVSAVQSPGPAMEAGVVRGDVIQAVDGQEVKRTTDLKARLAEYEPGDTIALQVLHGDEVRTLEVTLGDKHGEAHLGIMFCGAAPWEELEIRLSGEGFVIRKVMADSPAEDAGLLPGDVIFKVDGEELSSERTLVEAIAEHEPGDTISLDIRRKDEGELQVQVALAEHPEKGGEAYLGVVFHTPRFSGPLWDWAWPRAPDILPDLDLPHLDDLAVDAGVVVALLDGDSPAREAGISSGDIIQSVDGEPVNEPDELRAAVRAHKPGDTVDLTVSSPPYDEVRDVTVTLAGHPDEEGVAYLGVRIAAAFRFTHKDDLPRRFDFHLNPRGLLPRWLPWGSEDEHIERWIEPFVGRET